MVEQQSDFRSTADTESMWSTEDAGSETNVGSTLRDLLETALFIMLIFFIQRGLIQNFRIEGSSMEPNLHNYQYIWVNKVVYFHYDANAPRRLLPGNQDLPPRLVYPFRMPNRGDIVVLESPAADDGSPTDLIKRVIALPGETIQIKGGNVYINGTQLDEPYLEEATDCGGGGGINPGLCEPYVVPPHSVIVLGDNRDNSNDSRRWASAPGLPLERIVGKAWLSYWPRNDWGVIPSPAYAGDTAP